MNRIYITHCSARKDESLKSTGKFVTPDMLYTSQKIRSFISKCKEKEVNWAIFSDLYDICLPNNLISYYDKHPKYVTPAEESSLLSNFDHKLAAYDEIWFYYHPGRFHPLYDRILSNSKLSTKIRRFTHLVDIV
jgi:hypothetical protein